jgi:hypothetical protein
MLRIAYCVIVTMVTLLRDFRHYGIKFMTACVLCLNYYNRYHGNAVTDSRLYGLPGYQSSRLVVFIQCLYVSETIFTTRRTLLVSLEVKIGTYRYSTNCQFSVVLK